MAKKPLAFTLAVPTAGKSVTAQMNLGVLSDERVAIYGIVADQINEAFETHIQRSSLGAKIHLFEIDCTAIGGTIYRITPMSSEGAAGVVTWNAQDYSPFPVEASGFEWSSSGTLPQPTMRIANVLQTFAGDVISLSDFVGAKVTRRVTFARFLDDGEEPDPDACFPPEVYYIERKVAQTPLYIEWKLSSIIDQEGVYLPGRIVLKNGCSHRYRRFSVATGTFDYTNATCPYSGTSYFDRNNNPTDQAGLDYCSKNFAGCKARYGASAKPFRGFPGVGEVQ